MSDGAIKVDGLRELQAAFRRADRKMARDLRKELREAARPVADEAERLALSEIRNMTERWAMMRVGAGAREVYVVPRLRGTKNRNRKRPNLKDLLLDRAMEPALEREREHVVERIQHVLDTVASEWER